MIQFQALRAGYGGQEVLHGIDLTLAKGEITSLIGPNGCGKTTLLRAACGLLPLTGGKVLFRGRAREEYGKKEFARLAAFLPQARDVPALDVERFVSHGRYPHLSFGRDLSPADREAVRWAMEKTGVLDLRQRELSELSGGQRQRVYLAMALAQDAEILFLDEPTTYLDVGQKFEVMELIQELKALGKTVIMVLHDLPLAFSYSDSVAVLQDGNLKAFGPAEEVFDSGTPGEAFGTACRKLLLDGRTEYLFTPLRPERPDTEIPAACSAPPGEAAPSAPSALPGAPSETPRRR